MRNLAAVVLVVLSCIPAKAQTGGQPKDVRIEILELEQEADKAALKEALLLQAREGMKMLYRPEAEGREAEAYKKQQAEASATLREFIARKKEAITDRAARILAGRAEEGQGPVARTKDERDDVERYENAVIDAQLLGFQIDLLHPKLRKAIEALAAAESAADDDEARPETVETARKEYDEIKAKFVELNKRLYQERQIVVPMQMQMQTMGISGMGSMGAGMR